MDLKSLTYTSLARPGLSDADLVAIHHIALELNALDGITGLLVYNGVNFLQVIEGAEDAIDDLLKRLRADPRHSGLVVQNERLIDRREFPDWTMKLARVSAGYLTACEDISQQLPPELPVAIQDRVRDLTRVISSP